MIKTDIQDLIDITDIKRLIDKNGVQMSPLLSKQKYVKKCISIIFRYELELIQLHVLKS